MEDNGDFESCYLAMIRTMLNIIMLQQFPSNFPDCSASKLNRFHSTKAGDARAFIFQFCCRGCVRDSAQNEFSV